MGKRPRGENARCRAFSVYVGNGNQSPVFFEKKSGIFLVDTFIIIIFAAVKRKKKISRNIYMN